MAKIESLTTEQWAQIAEARRIALAEGSETRDTDEAKATALLQEAYRTCGYEPVPVYFFDSPLSACRALMAAGHTTQPTTSLWGQMDLYWIAHYRAARDIAGVTYDPAANAKLELMYGIAREISWWYPFEKACIACRHPSIVRWSDDPTPVLHSAVGPAVAWRDGWETYCWRGQRVPKEWIMQPTEIDPGLALTHPQIELRRCVAEIVGWDKVLERLQPKVIDEDADPEVGTLLEVDLPDSEGSRFLRVRCPTQRDFVLPVPAEMQSAAQAQAWTWGDDAFERGPRT